jgi:predicted signal transduction protein with EAL and GGDEF domain
VHILEIGRPAISAERVTISVAERIQKNIQAPFYIDGHGVFTTASIGIAFSGSGYSAAEDMLGDANTGSVPGRRPTARHGRKCATPRIDQSFARQITTAPDETTIVTAVISMGRSLKLRVVAEGVETQQELEFLQTQQCDEAQGYYFSRPVVAE